MTIRDKAPKLNNLAQPHIMDYQKISMSNGIDIYVTNDPNQEVFKLDAVFKAGVEYQPSRLISSTTLGMLCDGTSSKSSTDIAETFDYYGAYIDSNCGLRRSELDLLSPCKYAEPCISTMSEMVFDSIFPQSELDTNLRNRKQEFLVEREKCSWLARREFNTVFFGKEHPYANILDVDDFDKVDRNNIIGLYNSRIKNGCCTLFASGRIDDNILKLIEKYFNIKRATAPRDNDTPPFKSSPAGQYQVVKEGIVQCSIKIGKTGVRIGSDDYSAFQVLNCILGGYFSSRLMNTIREEKGYTYGISSFNVSYPKDAVWAIATDVNNEFAQDTIDSCFNEINKLRTEEVSLTELNLVKTYMQGELLREIDGVFSQSDTLKHKASFGMDNGIYIDLLKGIQEVTPKALLDIANKYLNPKEMYTVLVKN